MYAMNLQPGQTIRHDGQIYRATDKGRTFVNIVDGREMLLGPLVEVEPVEIEPEAPKTPSIVAVHTITRYGARGTVGNINRMDELSEDGGPAYAHSMDEAIAWVKAQPLFANVEPHSLGDGRLVFASEWAEVGPVYTMLYGYEDVTHTRQEITLYPVSTVGVSTGYR